MTAPPTKVAGAEDRHRRAGKVEAALAKLFPVRRGCTVPAGPIPACMRSAWWRISRCRLRRPACRCANSRSRSTRICRRTSGWSAPTAAARISTRGLTPPAAIPLLVWNTGDESLLRRQAWHVPRPLAVPPCAPPRNDFSAARLRAFTSNPGYERLSTVRRLTRVEVKRSGPLLTFVIEGDGFLYKMCRASSARSSRSARASSRWATFAGFGRAATGAGRG